MFWTAPQIAICLIGILHLVFMIGELYPWEHPWIMVRVLEKWPIVATGLFVAAFVGPTAFPVQIGLLAGGVVAGLFGAKTLTIMTLGQAILGAIAIVVVVCCR
jgi:hypothetical protein